MTRLLLTLAFSALLGGCAQQQQTKFVPRPTGIYTQPQFEVDKTSKLSGSIARLITTKTRARVESVDLQGIRVASEPEQPPVVVAMGKRSLVVVCETDMATAIDRTEVAVEFVAGHEYLLTCSAASLWSHTGSNFEILDVSAGNKVVATAFAPGRAYPPRGRLF
jgi:hypothetical protein